MIGIGNDLVHWSSVQGRSWTEKRKLQKLFSIQELALLEARENQGDQRMALRLWSMKESAYKLVQRVTKCPRTFQPKAYLCSLQGDRGRAKVETPIGPVYTKTEDFPEYLHTIAFGEKDAEYHCRVEKMEGAAKASNRQVLYLEVLENWYGLSAGLTIEKEQGIPWLVKAEERLPLPFSTSQDGPFLAVVALDKKLAMA